MKTKEKKYRVTVEHTVYSKKQGTILKKYTLLKNASLVECKAFIKQQYNVEIEGFEIAVKGMLYPSYIRIK
jgi:hypothetical protein